MQRITLPDDQELSEEIAPYRKWLKGRILNAGCGKRYIKLGEDVVRLDINPSFATAVDVQADAHHLPFAANSFDTIISIAVLEHTRWAWEVAKEFNRVLKVGGIAVVAIPFIQPRHGAPHDYVRFTDTGIRSMMEWAQFKVLEVTPALTFGFTVEWMMREFLRDRHTLRHIMWPIRKVVFPQIRKGHFLPKEVPNLVSAYYVIGEKTV